MSVLRTNCPYTLDQIQTAFDRSVRFFINNPSKHMKENMSNGTNNSPFDTDATCFCFAGYMVHELGPMPHPPPKYYAGYDELNSISHGLAARLYVINDTSETINEVLEREQKCLIEEGLIKT